MHEARNPKQAPKRKTGKSKTGPLISPFLLWVLNLFRVSCFGIRAYRPAPRPLSSLHRFPKRQPRLVHVRVDLEELVESDKVQRLEHQPRHRGELHVAAELHELV